MERLADRVVIVDHGKVVAVGRQGEIQGESEELRFAAEPGIALGELSVRLGAPVSEGPAGEYLVSAPPAPALAAELAGWLAERDLQLGDLRAGRQRLEDVFLRLTSGATEPAHADDRRPSSVSGRPSRKNRARP